MSEACDVIAAVSAPGVTGRIGEETAKRIIEALNAAGLVDLRDPDEVPPEPPAEGEVPAEETAALEGEASEEETSSRSRRRR